MSLADSQQYVNPNWLKQSCKHVYEQLCTISLHPDRQNAHLQAQLKFKHFPNLPVYSRYTVQRRDIILGIQVGLLVNTKDETQYIASSSFLAYFQRCV